MSLIYICQAAKNDLEQIMPIIDEAKKFLKEEGNPQWQSGYPNVETITADIENGVAWFLIVDQKKSRGTLRLQMGLIPIIKRLMANGIMILILMWQFIASPFLMSIAGCILLAT